VVVHNAGSFWPAHALRKRAGEVRVLISEPVAAAGRSSKEIQADINAVFDALMARLPRPEQDALTPARPT